MFPAVLMRWALLLHVFAGCVDWESLYSTNATVPHIPDQGAVAGNGDLTLVGSVTIHTGSLTVLGATLPTGVSFDSWPQVPSGPELAVLHVRALEIAAGASVRVVGPRPLVIISSRGVVIGGNLDGGAHRSEPGPGGASPGMGRGAGNPGV